MIVGCGGDPASSSLVWLALGVDERSCRLSWEDLESMDGERAPELGGAKLSEVYPDCSPGRFVERLRASFRLPSDLEGVKCAAIFDPKLLEVVAVFRDCCEVDACGREAIAPPCLQ